MEESESERRKGGRAPVSSEDGLARGAAANPTTALLLLALAWRIACRSLEEDTSIQLERGESEERERERDRERKRERDRETGRAKMRSRIRRRRRSSADIVLMDDSQRLTGNGINS